MTDASNARLSEATESSRPFSIRLTPDERNALDRAASARGLRPSTMARRAVLEASERPLPPVAIRRDRLASVVGQGVGELGRIGNLLNQVARIANARRTIAPDAAAAAYDRVVQELATVRTALLAAEDAGDAVA